MIKEHINIDYRQLVDKIVDRYKLAQRNVVSAVNTQMLYTYWDIGQYIVEFEQGGNDKAQYRTDLLENLSHDLFQLYGRGFSRSNLNYMRLLYNRYPIYETLSHKLKWSHYCELLKVDFKIGEVEHEHIGQMKLYLGYYTKEINEKSDNEPIELILTEEKDDIMVEYAMLNDISKLIVSKYRLYLPDIEDLKN